MLVHFYAGSLPIGISDKAIYKCSPVSAIYTMAMLVGGSKVSKNHNPVLSWDEDPLFVVFLQRRKRSKLNRNA